MPTGNFWLLPLASYVQIMNKKVQIAADYITFQIYIHVAVIIFYSKIIVLWMASSSRFERRPWTGWNPVSRRQPALGSKSQPERLRNDGKLLSIWWSVNFSEANLFRIKICTLSTEWQSPPTPTLIIRVESVALPFTLREYQLKYFWIEIQNHLLASFLECRLRSY